MNQQATPESRALWQSLVESEKAYHQARVRFMAEGVDRVPLVREGLHSRDRHTALSVVPSLSLAERLELFPDLVDVARAAHGPVGAVRDMILRLPQDWVLAHVEEVVEAILRNEEYDDYWMFLELYEKLDRGLMLKLARRAAAHQDPEIRELGEDWLVRAQQPQTTANQR
jgi:hypothetical protein